MNNNLTKTALDFIDAIDRTDQGRLEDHDYLKHLDTHSTFQRALKLTDASPYLLAEAVAKGQVVHAEDQTVPLNASIKAQLREHADALQTILKSAAVFECEFEQLLLLDFLEKLQNAEAPARGFRRAGEHESVQRRKLVQSISMDLLARNILPSPALVLELAAVVDPEVNRDQVAKQLQRADFEDWVTYSRDFFESVYAPHLEWEVRQQID